MLILTELVDCLYSRVLFDIGIYWPKLSIITFYWFSIPYVFDLFGKPLYIIMVYLICFLMAAILTVTLIIRPISNNW